MRIATKGAFWLFALAVIAVPTAFFGWRSLPPGNPAGHPDTLSAKEAVPSTNALREVSREYNGEGTSVEPPESEQPEHYSGPDPVPEFDVLQFRDPQEILDALGIDRDYWAWSRAQGGIDQQLLSTRHYAHMSVGQLTSLADQGDHGALLTLTSKLLSTSPVEAYDLLRRHADKGSSFAIELMASNLGGVVAMLESDRPPQWDELQKAGLEQIASAPGGIRTEAIAWSLVQESVSGQPRGTITRRWAGSDEDVLPPELGAACKRATEIYGQLRMAWEVGGIEPLSTEAAPIVFAEPEHRPAYLEACPPDSLPAADFSACKPFRIRWGFGDMHSITDMAGCPGN